jgi:hypothetical protein
MGLPKGHELGERWHRFIYKVETWNASYLMFTPRAWSFHKAKEAWTPIYLVRRVVLSRPYINECMGFKQSLFYASTQWVRNNCLNKYPCYMWVGSLVEWYCTMNKINTKAHIGNNHFFQITFIKEIILFHYEKI